MITAPKQPLPVVEDFYVFKIGAMWRYFKSDHYSFQFICLYLFFEFTRIQTIYPAIDIVPWSRLFLIGAIAGAFTDPKVKWVGSPSNKWIILFLLIVVIAIQTAIYKEIASSHFMDFFGWFLIYFLIINIINNPERLYIFICIFVVTAAKIAIGTTKQWAFRGFTFSGDGLLGPKGNFQNSGELSILMLMLLPLPFLLYRAHSTTCSLIEKIALTIFWVTPIVTIIGASSRGAQVALLAQLLILFRKSVFKIKPLLVLVVVVVIISTLLPQEQIDRFSKAGDDRTSIQRLLYWQHGLEMILDNPFTGVGYYNFIPYYEDHHASDMLYPNAQLPHNIFIQVGTDGGIPLMIALLALIVFCFLVAFKISRDQTVNNTWRGMAAALGYGVLGFTIAGQFVTVTYYPFLWIHLALIAAMRNIYLSNGMREPIHK